MNDAYPDIEDMLDVLRKDFIRRVAESVDIRSKEAKETAKKDKRDTNPDGSPREHVVGACWCGKSHPDHIRFGGKCWCGKEGIHNVGTPH
jgi:hypothetical protein